MPNKFSKSFLFGGASSDHQCEGGFKEDNKGISTGDTLMYDQTYDVSKGLGTAHMTREMFLQAINSDEDHKYPKRKGNDFYHRYEEDIELMSDMGWTISRMSISWARIFPHGDDQEPNAKGLAFYDNVFKKLKAKNIKIFVTVSHYAMPVDIVNKYGGWKNREVINLYMRYFKLIFDRYKEIVDFWLPFNEINISQMAPFLNNGLLIDESSNYDQDNYQALHHIFLASAKAVKYAHDHYSNAQMCGMICGRFTYPKTSKPADILASQYLNNIRAFFYLEVLANGCYPEYIKKYFDRQKIKIDTQPEDDKILLEGKVDIVSFSYYFTEIAEDTPGLYSSEVIWDLNSSNEYLQKTKPWNWAIDSIGLRWITTEIFNKFKKPIFIAENGIGFQETLDENNQIHDEYRIDYLKKHLSELSKAVNIDGVNLVGYTMWGAFDLVSSGTNQMSKRYGFVYVDANDDCSGSYNRFKKDSYHWIKKQLSSNFEDLD